MSVCIHAFHIILSEHSFTEADLRNVRIVGDIEASFMVVMNRKTKFLNNRKTYHLYSSVSGTVCSSKFYNRFLIWVFQRDSCPVTISDAKL